MLSHKSVNIHTPDRGFAPFCQTGLWGSVLRKKDCPDYTSQRALDCYASPTSDKLHNNPETVNIQTNMIISFKQEKIQKHNAVIILYYQQHCHFKSIWICIPQKTFTEITINSQLFMSHYNNYFIIMPLVAKQINSVSCNICSNKQWFL